MRRIAITTACCLLLFGCVRSNANNAQVNAAPPNTPARNAAPADNESPGLGDIPDGKAAYRRGVALKEFANAKELYAAGKTDEGLRAFEAAVDADNSLGEAHAWLGKVYAEKGRLSEAKLQHRDAARLAQTPEVRLQQSYLAAEMGYKLALAAYARRDYRPAEEQAKDALRDRPSYPEARRVLADALFRREQYAEARTQYQQVADESSADARREALNWVGQCGLRLNENEAAEKVFSALIKEGYNHNDVYAWRAWCRFNRKDLAGARQDFLQAIEHATSPEKRKEFQAALAEVEKAEKG